MWFSRLQQQLETSNCVLLQGGARWGTAHLFDRLPAKRKIWLWLEPSDADDTIALGNALSAAIDRAVKGNLCGHGVGFGYHLATLRQHQELLGPYTFLVSGAEHGIDLCRALMNFGTPHKVILDFETVFPPELRSSQTLEIQRADLALKLQEANDIAVQLGLESDLSKPVSEEAFLNNFAPFSGSSWIFPLWQDSQGAFENFMLELNAALGLPVPLRPTPVGHRFPPGSGPRVSPSELLRVLLREKRWLEALELAAKSLPHKVSQLLETTAPLYAEQGLYQRLARVLEWLPSELQNDSTVLFWQLQCAAQTGEQLALRERVEACLEANEAPELRALYAATLAPLKSYLQETQRAARAKATPLTLNHWGRALGLFKPLESEQVLRQSLDLAEQRGRAYDVSRNAEGLGAQMLVMGRYAEAARFLAYALSKFDQHGLKDLNQRLRILNDLVYVKLLLGETDDLESILLDAEVHLNEVTPATQSLLRSTIADFWLSQSNPEKALHYQQKNWQHSSRLGRGPDGHNLVRVLLELGENQQALRVGEEAYHLTKGEYFVYARRGEMAYGMALSARNPSTALVHLKAAFKAFQDPILADNFAQAGLFLAQTHLQLGQPELATQVLEQCSLGWEGLSESGRRFLAGPIESFQPVWTLLGGQPSGLELNFLGKPEVWLHGMRLPIVQKRFQEILLLLAINPQGLTGEQLLLLVYGEAGDLRNLKPMLSRLRDMVPLLSKPYRLGIDCKTDFQKVEQMLADNQLSEAMTLFRGSLLAESDAPGVMEYREILDEAIRQAAIASSNSSVLLKAAQHFPGDLELLELALEELNTNDPRRPLVAAKVEQLRRQYA
jgi:tetratricopeptide (TPR) repeat protein